MLVKSLPTYVYFFAKLLYGIQKALEGEVIRIAIASNPAWENGLCKRGLQQVPYPPVGKVDIVISTEKKEVNALLHLRPREYVIGMGCRKGKDAGKIEALLLYTLKELGLEMSQVWKFASIEQKRKEPAFLALSQKTKFPFVTYTVKELESVVGDFAESAFVETTVGISNVCERAARKACGSNGTIVYPKHAEDGMTIAIAKREWRIDFE